MRTTLDLEEDVLLAAREIARRGGVAGALLRGAIECARLHGAPALEAYPVDPGGKRIDATFAYAGTCTMFEREGFRRVGVHRLPLVVGKPGNDIV